MERTITGTVGEVKGRTVNTKYGEKTVFDIFIGSQKTSTFKSDIAEEAKALQGSDVEATVRVEPCEGYPDNYMLLGVKLVNPVASFGNAANGTATTTIPVTTAPTSDSRQESIVRQSSLKAAAAVYSGSGVDAGEVLAVADRFFRWVQGTVDGDEEPVAVGATESNDGVDW